MSIPRYIERLPLAAATPAPSPLPGLKVFLDTTRSGGAEPPVEPIPSDLKAAVNAGSLLSFVEGALIIVWSTRPGSGMAPAR